jgi:hypothetical protein
VVIRRFGLLNTNVPPDVTRFYGMPFPGQYLIGPNQTVREKLFLPDYQTRISASEVLLKNFGGSTGNNATVIGAEDVRATVKLSDVRSFSGQRLGFEVEIEVGSGWHIYGQPLPANYTATSVKFDDQLVAYQSLEFPKATPVKFESVGETLPVYQGSFKAVGEVLLKARIAPGEHQLGGTLAFQECSTEVCKIPQSVRFEIPIRVDAYAAAAK